MAYKFGGLYSSHDTSNDDVYGAGEDPRKKFGYLGDSSGGGVTIGSGDFSADAGSDWSPNGQGEQIINGYRQAGTSQYDKDVARYRQMGEAGMSRGGAQLDQTQGNESRGLQVGALGMLGTAAAGGAPSRAAVLGQAATDNTERGSLAGMAGARGPGAAVAGANVTGTGAANTMTQNNAQFTGMRGQEIAAAQKGFAGAANEVRGQDIGAATANAQLTARQRQLNEMRQEHMERLGYDVRNLQGQTAIDYQQQLDAQNNIRDQQHQQRDAIDKQHTNDAVSNFANMITFGVSDERAKEHVRPMAMGSLAGLSHRMHGYR